MWDLDQKRDRQVLWPLGPTASPTFYHVHEVYIIFSHFESGNFLKHSKQVI